VCDPAAIGPAVGAIGSAASASAQNKAARRNYEYQLKVRERKWMQTRSTYQTKKVQFEQEVDQANIAAQRAYSRTQQQLNNARSLAILQNQEDFKKMLANEGMIEVSAAERGVRGRSVARQLVQNNASFGMTQAMRSRALTQAGYQARETYGDINRQLKGQLNQSFSRVAIQPVQDVAPPRPVMQSPGLALMLGMAQAVGAGMEGAQAKQALRTPQMPTYTPPPAMNPGFMNTGIPMGNMLTPTNISANSYAAYTIASDRRLKENIEQVGISPQGYKIYEFNYKGGNIRFRGAMAQDVLNKNPMAVGIDQNHLTVDYSKIDVNMEVVK
tara:strand:+ start:218 stop:1201 length:984 start_codon:yes stop_codon:yes gene_type:complete